MTPPAPAVYTVDTRSPRTGGRALPGGGAAFGLPNVKKLSAPLAPRPFCAYNRKQDEGVRPRARNYKCDT